MKNQFQQITVAISLGVALACAVDSIAAPVTFNNPAPGELGHVDWEAIRFLDITKPPSQQVPLPAGAEVLGTFEFSISENFDVFTSTLQRNGVISIGLGGRIFRELEPGVGVGFGMLQPGDIVGPGGVIPQGGGGGYTSTFGLVAFFKAETSLLPWAKTFSV